MKTTKMRTRTYTDLTNYEIEQYLQRNDIIVIPVVIRWTVNSSWRKDMPG